MSEYVLPDIRYDYSAFEPHLSGLIVELHHDKHHRAYVEAANKALLDLAEARESEDFERIAGLERTLAFNVSGHILHSLYWQNLSPEGGGEPSGILGEAIAEDFGSFDRFKAQMVHACMTTMGSGWGALTYDALSGRLNVVQIHDHESNTLQGGVPIMVLDAWEHAYYLQYRADKKRYFEAIWNLWNWEDIATRYIAASGLDLLLPHAATDDRDVALHPLPPEP